MSNSVGISENNFKIGMRQLAAAVNIITTTHNGKKEGFNYEARMAKDFQLLDQEAWRWPLLKLLISRMQKVS